MYVHKNMLYMVLATAGSFGYWGRSYNVTLVDSGALACPLKYSSISISLIRITGMAVGDYVIRLYVSTP